MNGALAVSWNDTKRTGKTLSVMCLGAAALMTLGSPSGTRAVSDASGDLVSVIVRHQPGMQMGAEKAVTADGGRVDFTLSGSDSLVAEVPANRIAHLQTQGAIASLSRDHVGKLLGEGDKAPGEKLTLRDVSRETGAEHYWKAGFSGKGVDVALIDSGVVPVPGLNAPGKIVNGPDLSADGSDPKLAHLDGFGHGTHLAGIIAGNDGGQNGFQGIAPDARIVNVKASTPDGKTTDATIIAAIDWVVAHRTDNGMNIRVINLAYGSQGTGDYRTDPLAAAAERAMNAGIVVIVAAGNDGRADGKLMSPAYDPFVVAVGAQGGTGATAEVAAFSNVGSGDRNPDLVAPGAHIVSLRDPGSYLDQKFGRTAAVGTDYFRGSGTSQAAAVVAGAAALIAQEYPGASAYQIKRFFQHTTDGIGGGGRAAGDGRLSLRKGLGQHLENPDYHFAPAAAAVPTVPSGDWSGSSWSGSSWSGSSWSGSSWSGSSWSSASWS